MQLRREVPKHEGVELDTLTVKERVGQQLDVAALRRYRLSRVQEQLSSADIGAVVLFEPQNIRYATDMTDANLLWTSYAPVRYSFVPAHGIPVMFEYALDTRPSSTRDTGLVDDIRPATSFATFYHLDGKAPCIEAWIEGLQDLIREHCGASRRIAVDSLAPSAVPALVDKGFTVLDGDGLMMRARLIKSAQEIQCLRAAVEVADLAAARIRERLEPGVTEQQLWALLQQTNAEEGGEWVETRLLTSGARTNPWYQAASEKRLAEGELLVFDTDLVGPFGYVGDISRAYLCGDRPTPDQRQLYRIAFDTLHHNLDLMAPGISFREIAERCFVPPEAFRQTQEAVGHGAGVQIEFPLLCTAAEIHRMPYPEMVLEPGMVLCAEAYAGAVGGREGVKLEQQFAVTETGFDLMSTTPFDETLLG